MYAAAVKTLPNYTDFPIVGGGGIKLSIPIGLKGFESANSNMNRFQKTAANSI
jgi:hypothetical protein